MRVAYKKLFFVILFSCMVYGFCDLFQCELKGKIRKKGGSECCVDTCAWNPWST